MFRRNVAILGNERRQLKMELYRSATTQERQNIPQRFGRGIELATGGAAGQD